MKTTIKAKVVIDTNKYDTCNWDVGKIMLTLEKIKDEIRKGAYKLEWINNELGQDNEPTIIIKL